ncbi:MAG: hypothetical protein GY793_06745 [Proteobacteria bacterium]|nr:hypothetical protein [Pseudomonadota bacterium]
MGKFILQIFIILFSINAYAVDSVKLDVTSDKLEVEKATETAVFSGDVIAKYQEVTMKSDKLKVEYDSKQTNKQKRIKLITATGHVHLTQKGDIIDSDKAEYFVNDDNIIFKDNVVLNRNGNIIKGDHLTVNMITKKVEMRALGKKRVQAIYYNKPKEK